MITEDYCSYEVSKLLKEKGFDEPCYRWYDTKGDICAKFINPDIPLNYSSREHYLCPSQSMAMKWLREKHIIIVVQPEYFNGGVECSYWGVDIWADDNYEKLQGDFPAYEQAVEAALKYSLENLI